MYLYIQGAYDSGRLRDRITPRCYGAFEGDGVDVLILDLCDSILNTWDELGPNQQRDILANHNFYSAIRLSEPFGTVGGGRGLNWAPKAWSRVGVGVEICKRK
jgi:hypothetical protein